MYSDESSQEEEENNNNKPIKQVKQIESDQSSDMSSDHYK